MHAVLDRYHRQTSYPFEADTERNKVMFTPDQAEVAFAPSAKRRDEFGESQWRASCILLEELFLFVVRGGRKDPVREFLAYF